MALSEQVEHIKDNIKDMITTLILFLLIIPATQGAILDTVSGCTFLGDLDKNSIVDMTDKRLIAEYLVGLHNFSKTCLAKADLNHDGRVSLADLLVTTYDGAIPVRTPATQSMPAQGTALIESTVRSTSLPVYSCVTIRGDMDGDCDVDMVDSQIYAWIDAGLANYTGNMRLCDINPVYTGDGRINILDSLLAARVAEGLVPHFPDKCADVTQCTDGLDNDNDGLFDSQDPDCTSDEDNNEHPDTLPQCSDLIDNDDDGLIDYPADPGCTSLADDDESNNNDGNNDNNGNGSTAGSVASHPEDLFVSNIRFLEDGFTAGDTMRMSLTLTNLGSVKLHDLKIALSIPELGIRNSQGLFNLGKNDQLTTGISLDIPASVYEGDYTVRIFISSKEHIRVIHRPLHINTASSLTPLVHKVITVYCPQGYPSCAVVPAVSMGNL